ncbi:MAG TPA: site-specific DNA-methyltransferase [Thermoplasmata archaeon]|nr:site-specific DNA-methyltransferase [Thermoplasmata archaeon]
MPLSLFDEVRLLRGRSVRLFCEDALPGLAARLGRTRADVVVTSPPYNLGVRYSTYRDDRPREEYLRWTGALRDSVRSVLARNGSFFLNIGGPPSDPWLPWDVARVVAEGFVLQNVLHWVKSIAIDRASAGRSSGVGSDLALGHYKPVQSDRYVHGAQEYVFHFTRRGDVPLDRLAIGVPYGDKSNVRRWQASRAGLRCRGNTWFLPYPTIRFRSRDRPHPATFPPELPEWCVRLHGLRRTRLVVDPFVGIGSSAVAAARLGVSFVGFDLDRAYLTVAAERVRSELKTARRPGRSRTDRRAAGPTGPSRTAATPR